MITVGSLVIIVIYLLAFLAMHCLLPLPKPSFSCVKADVEHLLRYQAHEVLPFLRKDVALVLDELAERQSMNRRCTINVTLHSHLLK